MNELNDDNNVRIISEKEYNQLLYRFLDSNEQLSPLEMRRMQEYETFIENQKNIAEGNSKGKQYSLNNHHQGHAITIDDDDNRGAINAIIIILIVLFIGTVIAFFAMGLIG